MTDERSRPTLHAREGIDHDAPDRFGRAFALGIALNAAYVAGEAGFGLRAHSLALVADAGHNLGDVLGLGAAWLARILGRRAPTPRFTYGWRASSILAALLNAGLLLLVTGGIAAEAVRLLFAPVPVAGRTVIVVASVGIAVNGGTALLFMAGRQGDLNLRAAFSHMAADALVALGVVVAGALILATGIRAIDPVASLAVGAVILVGTWSLLRDSVLFALDAVPPGVDHAGIAASLAGLPGVVAVNDLHIWGMSTTETALTARLLCGGTDAPAADGVAEMLRDRHGIAHATIECGSRARPCALAADSSAGGGRAAS